MVRILAVSSIPIVLVLWLCGIALGADAKVRSEIPRRVDCKPKFVSDAEVVRYINDEIRRGWRDAALEPSPVATAGEWCRRVFLDVLGRIPSTGELQQFEREPATHRKSALVHRLLDSSEYAEEYSQYWAAVWSHVLVGRPIAGEEPANDSLTNYDGLRQYLRTSLCGNKPYDVMVYELLTATGDTTPGEPDFNGATNFLIDGIEEDAVEATKRTALCFLGFHAHCAQCHCEPYTGWQQAQFWSLNSFFRQARVRPMRSPGGRIHAVLRDEDFVGESNDPQQAEVYFETIQGKLLAAFPAYIDDTKIHASGEVRTVNRRAELGRFVIQSEQLGTALANRMWAQFFGFDFSAYGEIDQLGPRGELVRSAMPAVLGHEFVARGFDLKRLISWLVLSEPYSLSSRITSKNVADQHGRRDSHRFPQFSHFYLRQMQPEQIYASMLVAAGANRTGHDPASGIRKGALLSQLAVASGNPTASRAVLTSGTVPLALLLMNGEFSIQATSLASASLLQRHSPHATRPAAIDTMFLAAFSRKPTPSERSSIAGFLAGRMSEPDSAYQDLWWAVFNSNEFLFNH